MFARLRVITPLIVALLAGVSAGQSPTKAATVLVAPPSARDVTHSDEGYWFAEGCQRLDYTVSEPFPGESVSASISNKLRGDGWRPIHHSEQGVPVSSALNKKLGRWESWDNAVGGKTSERVDLWRNEAGDIVNYTFWYKTSDHKTLEVVGRFCSSSVIRKYQCNPQKQITHRPSDYSLALQITKIEPSGKDFKVSVSLENDGREPVLVGVNGEFEDGSPELWVLGVEQEESGTWSSVDAICAEHPAFNYITLKPGESIDSWVMAIDFPEANHRFAKCTRHVAHLHGKVRAYIRYYTNPCEFLNPLESQVYSSVSEPNDLPILEKRSP